MTSNLSNLSKPELIQLILKLAARPIIKTTTKRPIATPRKGVKQLVEDYENNIIKPPHQFRDDYMPRKPIPLPRTVKPVEKPIPAARTRKTMIQPVPAPRTIIEQTAHALKGFTVSYQINIKNNTDPLVHLKATRKTIEHHLKNRLMSMKGLKFVETLKVIFNKLSGSEMIQKTAFFNSAAQTIINPTETSEATELSKQQILNKVVQWVSEGSGWMIKSIDNHYLNIVKYEPIKGSSYIQLPLELRNASKGLINLQNKDNECFRWCHIRHLNPQTKDPQRIKKADRQYIPNLDYEGIDFPVTIKQYNRIEKQNSININVFGYEDKQPFPICVSKAKNEDHMDLLLITENENMHYVLFQDFNKFLFKQTKQKETKHFCRYCLQCFSSERVLTDHQENCITINGTQAIKMPTKEDNILKFNNHQKQLQAPFVIYADFESLLEKVHSCQPCDNKSYIEAYQKHRDSSYCHKVVCCYDDKYSKPTQIYRGENAAYKFMEAMLKKVKYCRKMNKKHFNKRLRMTEKNSKKPTNVIYVIKLILKKRSKKEIIVISLVNIEDLH